MEFPMTGRLFCTTFALLLWPVTGLAGERVIHDVRPYFETRQAPTQQWVCEPATRDLRRERGAQLLGGLAGGYLGSEIGAGRGQQVAAVAGALAGAELGRRQLAAPRERCRMVYGTVERNEIGGYDVIYEENGRLWRKRTTEAPEPAVKP
jgi:uncharacterized protein YcfJ